MNTIVFDLGKVLVSFDPEKGMRELGFNENVIRIFMEKLFGDIWIQCDQFAHNEEETRQLCKDAVPGYEKEVDELWNHLPVVTGVMPYAREWLTDLKRRGYRLLVLSNYGQASFEINSKIYDFLELMDGGVVSYQIERVKPDPSIYLYLFEKYQLNPAEAVFIDDRPENVEGAKALGMQGIVFENFEQARDALNQILNEA